MTITGFTHGTSADVPAQRFSGLRFSRELVVGATGATRKRTELSPRAIAARYRSVLLLVGMGCRPENYLPGVGRCEVRRSKTHRRCLYRAYADSERQVQ